MVAVEMSSDDSDSRTQREIAQEIKMQIAAEKEPLHIPIPGGAVSSTPPSGEQTGPDETPAALIPITRIFVVSQVVSSSNPDGTECSLSPRRHSLQSC